MKFDNLNIYSSKLRKEIETFLSSTGRLQWENLIEKLDSNSIFYRYYQYARIPFLSQLKKYFELDKKGISINNTRDNDILYLSEIVVIFNRINNNLNKKAKNILLSRITSNDSRSILFELKTAAHFLKNSFDVSFIEYEREIDKGKTFDLLIKKGNIIAEVECKTKSYESGRNIGRDRLYLLADEIVKRLKNVKTNCLIIIKTSSKLPKEQKAMHNIRDSVISLIGDDTIDSLNLETYSIKKVQLNNTSPIKDNSDLEKIIASYKTDKSHTISLSLANELWNIVLIVESEKDDSVVTSIFNELKNAKKQFSRNNPGLLAIRLEGVEPAEWESLGANSSLAHMTKHFFDKENCPYIHTITYSSDITLESKGNLTEINTKSLIYQNPNSQYFKEIDIFNFHKKH